MAASLPTSDNTKRRQNFEDEKIFRSLTASPTYSDGQKKGMSLNVCKKSQSDYNIRGNRSKITQRNRQYFPRNEQNWQGYRGHSHSYRGRLPSPRTSQTSCDDQQPLRKEIVFKRQLIKEPRQESRNLMFSSKGSNAIEDSCLQDCQPWNRNHQRESKGHNFRPNKLGFKRLQLMARKDPDEIVVELQNGKNEFNDLLEKELTPDTIMVIAEILAKMTSSKLLENKSSLFAIVFQPNVLGIFSEHSGNIYAKDFGYSDAAVINYFQNLSLFFHECIDIFPNSAVDFLKEHLRRTIMGLQILKMTKKLHISEELEQSFNDILSNLASLESSGKTHAPKQNKRLRTLEWKLPGIDFREVSSYPLPKDLIENSKNNLSPVIVKGPYKSVEHYLNVQFHLLREDYIIPFRNGVMNFYDQKTANNSSFKPAENVRFYRDVQFISQFFQGTSLISEVFFDSKGKYSKMNWKSSKKFKYGSLICFSSNSFKSIFIGIVSRREVAKLEKGILECELLGEVEEKNLFGKKFIMAESEIYFETYFHVLNALKSFNENNFPFREYIIDVSSEVCLPRYLTTELDVWYIYDGFRFQVLDKSTWPSKKILEVNDSQFEALYSALTQKLAVIQGPPGTGKTYLGLKIAKILMDNKMCWKGSDEGPILIVCYTNHALDQFLEGILQYTRNIVRVGGQSKSEELAPFNLKNHRKTREVGTAISIVESDLKVKALEISSINSKLQELRSRPGILSLEHLSPYMWIGHSSWFCGNDKLLVEWLLEGAYGNQISDVNLSDLDNFATEMSLRYAKTLLDLGMEIQNLDGSFKYATDESLDNLQEMRYLFVNRLFYCKSKLSESIEWDDELILRLNKENKLGKLHLNMRWILYNYWVSEAHKDFDEKMSQARQDYQSLSKRKSELVDLENLKIMERADFVGITTTGAARLQALLGMLGAKIVIVEEAAEVMESHVIASLSYECEHLILIGDHKQLRPSTAVYKLAKEYNFDVSLFERMLRNDVPYNTLEIQHRMRPEIADLIIPAVYPALENHEKVHHYDHVLGIEKNMFFINHSHPEEQVEFCMSKKNTAESDFMIAICRHIVLQGYDPGQITILTFYLGQMFTLMEEKGKHAIIKDVKITCVDNYQGEENDIILLSLVRSNDEGKVGFTVSENRICVALSRAKKGLYVIGNMELLASKSKLWEKVVEVLMKKGAIGNKLTLKCVKHPNQRVEVCKGEDFIPLTEGGCTLLCNSVLNCGHICRKKCHMNSHDSYLCKEICGKEMCMYKHKCKKVCFEDCGDCFVPLFSELPCGHWSNIPCCIDPLEFKCNEVVTVNLKDCGHSIKKKCYIEVSNAKCYWDCDSRLQCGHACSMKCHVNNDPDHYEYKCLRPCGRRNRNCKEEHLCEKKCYEECSYCTFKVKRKLPDCQHIVTMECHQDASLIQCLKKCQKVLECGHRCPLKCYQKCGGCEVIVEKKIEGCNHEIKIKCHKAPERKLCKNKCERFLSCGHKCERLCREPCERNMCKVLIDDLVDSPCGHKVRKYCHESYSGMDMISLSKRCTELCSKILSCGHRCKGTCGSCLQGRIHIECQEKCGRNLICGHECKVLCSKFCPPCKKQCFILCEHSICTKKCGQPCVSCKEPCNWVCKHYKCSKQCGEMCDRPQCNEPCEKMLGCGHPCIGLCGEQCPTLCRECDSAEIDDISSFLPSEDEIPRFFMLPDCTHVFDVKGLDTWLSIDTGSIKILRCPKCTTPIQKAKRYGNFVKQHFINVKKVKKEVFGCMKASRKDMFEDYQKFTQLHRNIQVNFPNIFCKLEPLVQNVKERVFQRAPLSISEMNSLRERIQFSNIVFKCLNIPVDSTNTTYHSYAVMLIVKILDNLEFISEQQHSDLHKECQRFQLMGELFSIESTPNFKSKNSILNVITLYGDCKALITNLKPFEPDSYNSIREKLNELKKLVFGYVGIPIYEMKIVRHAFGAHQGEWYTCPNGHVYSVGECGRPMEENVCYECNERIGGRNHQLLYSNSVFSVPL